ncbi:phospholipase D/Transphosphatidylase [Halalkalibacter wakoensis JCM 9140]|uniref:Phospholipase D/Transphosphatidylase n=1 Tax=Halalkalibacter wakoensis JCM 9140 TaxID=1236970 RepID=W4PXQ6_9BACI|nr:phospholipase D/Transphosphatidylase [Halalkalibacter wakoensis JCM 9140]
MKATLLWITAGIMGLYILYALIFGLYLFRFQPITVMTNEQERLLEESNHEESQDRVVLVEEREEAFLARIHLIQQAQNSLDIAYHTIHEGTASDLFFTSIVDAANRGVQVRLILDGILHHLRGNNKDIIYAFAAHPNIEIKFYEPFDALRPWTWNNRLHDKIMIVDQEMAMIGGRNIGDSYFAPEGYEGAKYDRDVVILNTLPEMIEESVISEIKDYYELVWNHDYTKKAIRSVTKKQKHRGEKRLIELKQVKNKYTNVFQKEYNWIDQSVPTTGITFHHNPIERFHKEPIVWETIKGLMNQAENSIYIQSPYIIPKNNMINYGEIRNLSATNMIILTNSLAATPNVLAYSGYMQHRKKFAHSDFLLYEYQSTTESLHTKTYIFDSRISVVGSFNLDSRSAYLSTESVVIIDSKEFADLLESNIDCKIEKDSLLVAGDGAYVEDPTIEPSKVSFFKRGLTTVLNRVTRHFQYLL